MARGAEMPPPTTAEEIVQKYLDMPHPENDRTGETRIARLAVLEELSKQPNAVRAIRDALAEAEDPKKRKELVEVCGREIQTKDSAILLIELLEDPNGEVRREAISGLRRLSSRITRRGQSRMARPADFNRKEAERVIREQMQKGGTKSGEAKTERDSHVGRTMPLEGGPDFAPKVEGLIPHLIKAVNDDEERNRILALYALADTRDPLAQLELRNRLQDSSEKVRFEAACLLCEFRDASGLAELQAALQQFQTANEDKRRDPLYYSHAQRLLFSFERITGKSMGAIPPDPNFLSDTRERPQIDERYALLLRNWATWWAWQPDVEGD
jgi:HEAT repeat protein